MSYRHALGIVALVVAAAGSAQAKTLPDNNLYLQDNLESKAGITQAQFNAVIDRAQKFYAPIIQKLGGTLTINRLWDDATVNADSQQSGTSWVVDMYGGLARRPEVTVDGFALVLCHELGHHLGGFPFVQDWAADEGQADYYATTHCAQVIWKDEAAVNAESRATVDPTAKAKCDEVWTTQAAQDLCYRNMMGSKSLADLLAALGGTEASFDKTDPSQVDTTNDDHPAAQCRLDTYVAGATCIAPYDAAVIPGKVDGTGQNDTAAERQSGSQYCESTTEYSHGFRPRCWFKPGI